MRISLEQTISLLQMGQVVAIPTETVYGLAALLSDEAAIEKIFHIKGRPSSNPLIVHIADKELCAKYSTLASKEFDHLIEAFWPGPLTIVLPVREGVVPSIARAGLPTAAFRMPAHPLALEILRSVSAFVAPSANLSGTPSATQAEHVENDFGSHFPVLDGGRCVQGLESTILVKQDECWKVARLGSLSKEKIAEVLGYLPEDASNDSSQPLCPGQLFMHYAPKSRLYLSRVEYESCLNKRPIVIGFSERKYRGAEKIFSLGSLTKPEEAAFRLYDVLRQLDRDGVKEAWVDSNIPCAGVWLTILERLTRASIKAPVDRGSAALH